MNGVEYVFGNEHIDAKPLQPFDDEVCSFISGLSMMLMKSTAIRIYPDIAALAFWCRRGNLELLKKRCPEAAQRLGRGLCFHIAPGNIPINFAFTYLFGLISGCSNIVRLPSYPFQQVVPVLEGIKKTLNSFPNIAAKTVFVRYPADNTITAEFSKQADARLIWGGDKTVESVKGLPCKPRCVDVAFADRYSICLINGQKVLSLNDSALERLAESFYNDTYLMDQNACSSPQLLCWLEDSEKARMRFWNAVYSQAEKKYNLQPAASIDKFARMCEDAIELKVLKGVMRTGNLLYRAELSGFAEDMTVLRGNSGYFYEIAINELNELAAIITEKYQTVTYFGVDPTNIQEFVLRNRLQGVDRITPVGKAMDISVIWDGFDLVRMLSRLVNVE